MRYSKNKKGFTLIEIIVVLIILGVLAAIALPSLFAWIDRSHSSEAVPTLKNLADNMDACLYSGKDAGICLNSTIQSAVVTPYFTFSGSQSGGGTYMIYASWNYLQNPRPLGPMSFTCPGQPGGVSSISDYGTIALCYNATTQQRSMTSTGIFQGMY